MNTTINGKTIEQVQKEFKMPFDSSLTKENLNGFVYVESSNYRERLDNVIGIFNYDEEYKQVEVVNLSNAYEIAVICRLTIKDDNGNVVKIVEASGGSKVIIPKESGKPQAMKNDLDTACIDAYRRCCVRLGIGNDIKEMNKAKKKKNKDN